MQPSPLTAWHHIVATKEMSALSSLLADDVVFESPVVHTPQLGKEITTSYLQAALAVLNNDTFTYRNEWLANNSAVLEFTTIVQGITINGVDLITWNESGQISHFKVMVRPLKAINTLHAIMGAQLAQ